MKTYSATQIQHWPVCRLQPYDGNPRTHSAEQIEQIASSMREFGFTNPILVDQNAGILAGHARLCAARSLNLEAVPVIVLDSLTEVQKRAYIIADNQLALNAGWDDALLAEELARLEADGFLSKSRASTMKHSLGCSTSTSLRPTRTPLRQSGLARSHDKERSGISERTASSAATPRMNPRFPASWPDSKRIWPSPTRPTT